MKQILTTVILLISAWLVFSAHEFWLAPSQFKLKVGEKTQLDFLVGEDFHGEIWGVRTKRTLSLYHFAGKTKQDLTAFATATDSTPIDLNFKKAGTHLLAMRSHNSYLEMEADKFNEYLKEDGIENILALREQRNELNKPSRENYQRCAKALLQVGNKTDETYSINCGMPLEMLPLKNPYKLKVGDKLPIQILFQGKPFPNATVLTWQKADETKTEEGRLRTNAQGIVEVPLTAKGYWMVSLVRMEENTDKSKAEYQTYWGV